MPQKKKTATGTARATKKKAVEATSASDAKNLVIVECLQSFLSPIVLFLARQSVQRIQYINSKLVTFQFISKI